MEDSQKTRGLLIAELEELRKRYATLRELALRVEDAVTHLPFAHAMRRTAIKTLGDSLRGGSL